MGIEKLPVVIVHNLGKMCYRKAYDVQKDACQNILKYIASKDFESIQNYLFLVEHEPVYTVGIRNKQYVEGQDKLKNLGADFVVTDRGGLITFHGPGQLVSYPVLYLGHFNSKKSIKWYVRQLENTIIDTCRSFNVKATTTSDVGVWIEDRKIAAIVLKKLLIIHNVLLKNNNEYPWVTICDHPRYRIKLQCGFKLVFSYRALWNRRERSNIII
ncbi:hypothetical protein NPIL_179571 [Nephila pilipes]|uniref:lipoyl(octanoyl) transferase n=1 Tax=Nephila pilipes TaxID=299642 RepID=A0A8X6T8Q0_NEPPI|nr:hypothetical protein NPIL_179571 [Nephila pilipes]